MSFVISTVLCILALSFINKMGKDKEKELPKKPLIHLFFKGVAAALIIVAVAVIFDGWEESFFENVLGISSTSLLYTLIDRFLVIALVEEGLKYIALRTYLKKHDIISCSHHLVTAMVAVGAGFTAAENILYMFGDAGLLVRVIFGISGHFTYAVFMGYALAQAMKTDDETAKKKYCRNALLVPFVMHGIYDFCLCILQYDMDDFLLLFLFVVMLGAYIKFYIMAAVKKMKETAGEALPAADSQPVGIQ